MVARIAWLLRHRRFLWPACGSLAVLLTVAAAWLWAHEGHATLPVQGLAVDREHGRIQLSPDAREALDVRTVQVAKEESGEPIRAPFTVESPWGRHAFAGSRLGGRITALRVRPGDMVAKDQPLAEVESLDMRDLEVEVANARSEVGLNAKNLSYVEAAAKQGTISEQQLFDARSKKQEADNALFIARRKLEILGIPETTSPELAPRTLVIRAPLGGIILHADVRLGQIIEPEQHLFEIVDPSSVEIQIHVQERDLQRISPGQEVELRPNLARRPSPALQARVVAKGMALEPQTALASVWAQVTSPSSPPQPGMNGVAILQTAVQSTLTIPPEALLSQGAERFVFVEEGPGQYVRKNVVIGWRTEEHVTIRNGALVAGDFVVTKGNLELAKHFPLESLRLSTEAEQALGLHVDRVRARPIAEVFESNGVLEVPPDQRGLASAGLSGAVQRLHVQRDQTVSGGDLLADVASLELQQLQLEMLRSHLQLEVVDQSLARLQKLVDAGNSGISMREFRETQNNRNALRQKRNGLRSKLHTAGLTEAQLDGILERRQFIESLPVRAPVGGKVVRFLGKLGQQVKTNDQLFEIQDPGRLWLHGSVPERDASRVHAGQSLRVRLIAPPGKIVETVVRAVGPEVDRETRTLSLWADWPSAANAELADGTPVRLNVVVSETQAPLAVPRQAVIRDGFHEYVFVRKSDGSFERRRIQTGRRDDRFVEILAGLSAGDPVVDEGAAGLQDAFGALQ
jgi:RND family efflux transporter MFP subunit